MRPSSWSSRIASAVIHGLGIFALCLIGLISCGQPTPTSPVVSSQVVSGKIVIGGPTGGDPIKTYRDYCAWMNYLEARLGCSVEMVFTDGNIDLFERMRRGEFDVVMMGPLQFAEAERVSPYTMMLTQVIRGKTSYRSAIITRKDWGFLSLRDLRGKRVAFVDKESASGYLYPSFMLMHAGLRPGDFESFFADKHENVVREVFERRVHAGGVYAGQDGTTAAANVFGNDPNRINQITTLAISEDIPGPGLAFSNDFLRLRPALSGRFIEVLLGISTDTLGAVVMSHLNHAGHEEAYAPTDSQAVETMRQFSAMTEEIVR